MMVVFNFDVKLRTWRHGLFLQKRLSSQSPCLAVACVLRSASPERAPSSTCTLLDATVRVALWLFVRFSVAPPPQNVVLLLDAILAPSHLNRCPFLFQS